jgi:TrmH family RNA methyltransferase
VLLDGWHLLHDAAGASLEITTVAVLTPPPHARDAELLARLAHHTEIVTVSRAVMDAISPVRTPAGVAALAVRRRYALEDLIRPSPALLIVAMDVQDPGNAGAIVRSAEAGGATGVLLGGASADPWQWKALRASMGSMFRLPVIRNTDSLPVERLQAAGLELVATVPRGGTPLDRVDLTAPCAILFGAEGSGLDDELLSVADHRLSIPMRPAVESLNVAVAAAVLVYEARRQREA